MPSISCEDDLRRIPPKARRRILENVADQLVENMRQELAENYIVTAGWIAGGLLTLLGKYGNDLICDPTNARVFRTSYATIPVAATGWWNKIETKVKTSCFTEEQIACVLRRISKTLSIAVYSNT